MDTPQIDDETPQEALKSSTYRLPVDLAEWVDKEFPHGFRQAFVLQCFQSLRYVMTEGELPPHNEYARAASLDALQQLVNPTR